MVSRISVEKGFTDDCSFMAYGFNPYLTEKSPYHGAYLAVLESICRLAASGAPMRKVYLTFQEYFERMTQDPRKWGKPLSALLGALKAQTDYDAAAIGGKDSMSGTFENISVPPTLVSFAVATGHTADAVSPEFKKAGHRVILVKPVYGPFGIPDTGSEKKVLAFAEELLHSGRAVSAWTCGYGGIAEAVLKMSFGNGIGFRFASEDIPELSAFLYGSFILELSGDEGMCRTENDFSVSVLGETIEEEKYICGEESVSLAGMQKLWEGKLEPIFSCNDIREQPAEIFPAVSFIGGRTIRADMQVVRPHVLIPVFPGTNCEYDSAAAWRRAGADPEIFVVNNLTRESIAASVREFALRVRSSQIIFIPGGFSGGDEPDGSGKFITAFFRNPELSEAVTDLMENRDGLMAGICNGFQALIKLGLLPYGMITEPRPDDPTLTYNIIGRHQSRIVRTRVCSDISPWLSGCRVGEVYSVPVSHGEGRFVADQKTLERLLKNGQIATQYVDLGGSPTSDIRFNPNGSSLAVEGITSPDGRVFGKMGHTERTGKGLYRNVPGDYDMKIFESAVHYFS